MDTIGTEESFLIREMSLLGVSLKRGSTVLLSGYNWRCCTHLLWDKFVKDFLVKFPMKVLSVPSTP